MTGVKPPLSYRLRIRWLRFVSLVAHRPRLKAMGTGSFIESPLLVLGHRNIAIGDRTSIRAGARIEAHQRFPHRVPQLTIGSDTNIEQNVHIVCHSRVTIGGSVSITGGCAIVDVTHPFGPEIRKVGDAIVDEDSFVEIGDGAFIGYGVVVLPNVSIGEGAIIGANSVVAADVPARAVAAGVPARVLAMRDEVSPVDAT